MKLNLNYTFYSIAIFMIVLDLTFTETLLIDTPKVVNNNFNNREKTLFIFNNVNPHIYKLTAQGSTLTFQLTGLVATDKLDVTSLEKIFTSQALMLAWSNNSRITSKT